LVNPSVGALEDFSALTAAYTWAPDGAGAFRKFKYRTYGEITAVVHDLERRFPQWVEVYSAQQRYGLPSPGFLACRDETGEPVACEHWVVSVTDEASLPDPNRPEVFFSGALHGNERVGPNAVTEMLIYLLETRAEKGAGSWAGQMIRSRRIVAMPTTNALGYQENTREEGRVDPNRDFPFDQSPSKCMVTVAARAVNEVWREHLFQLAVTFHGGMQAIAYEWGSFNHFTRDHRSPESPDDAAQTALAAKMRGFAGSMQGSLYPTGRLNDLVYAVHGGMEDWAYAASWDPGGSRPCEPTTFGGYPADRTAYSASMIRAFNFLVETWDVKTPRASDLGDARSVVLPTARDGSNASDQGDGHVARNLRLGLLLIDLAQPYVLVQCPTVVERASGGALERVPSPGASSPGASSPGASSPGASAEPPVGDGGGPRGGATGTDRARALLCGGALNGGTGSPGGGALNGGAGSPGAWSTMRVDAPPEGSDRRLRVAWEVGGALKADAAEVMWGLWPAGPQRDEARGDLGEGWTEKARAEGRLLGSATAAGGGTRWGDMGADGSGFVDWDSQRFDEEGSTAEIRIGELPRDVDLFVIVRARVDSALAEQSGRQQPDLPPQSHWVNARTNGDWDMSNNGRRVRGRLWWYSRPVLLRVSAAKAGVAEAAGGDADRGDSSADETEERDAAAAGAEASGGDMGEGEGGATSGHDPSSDGGIPSSVQRTGGALSRPHDASVPTDADKPASFRAVGALGGVFAVAMCWMLVSGALEKGASSRSGGGAGYSHVDNPDLWQHADVVIDSDENDERGGVSEAVSVAVGSSGVEMTPLPRRVDPS
jgi:hypothetical protein